MTRRIEIYESDLDHVAAASIQRWCRYLGMPEGSSGSRRALVLWLAYAGHIVPSMATRRRIERHS